jgi:hypothetical protein
MRDVDQPDPAPLPAPVEAAEIPGGAGTASKAAVFERLLPSYAAIPEDALRRVPRESMAIRVLVKALIARAEQPGLAVARAELPASQVSPRLVTELEDALDGYEHALRLPVEVRPPRVPPELRSRAEAHYDRMKAVCEFVLGEETEARPELDAVPHRGSYEGLIQGLEKLAELELAWASTLDDLTIRHQKDDAEVALELADALTAALAADSLRVAGPPLVRRAFTHLVHVYDELAAVVEFLSRKDPRRQRPPSLFSVGRTRKGAAGPKPEADTAPPKRAATDEALETSAAPG